MRCVCEVCVCLLIHTIVRASYLKAGKARGPWVQEVFSRLDLATPGVFLQVKKLFLH